MRVRPKKFLGQHFLKDSNIAKTITQSLTLRGYQNILEIGPGMGALTTHLANIPAKIKLLEIDTDSVVFLEKNFSEFSKHIIHADVLKYDISKIFNGEPFAVIGNFPYNISTQIIFKILDYKDCVPEFLGMFQKEVAERICEVEGSKCYGILSVLVQAFYEVEYLFTVPPVAFTPKPKIQSGVIRLIRKSDYRLGCNEILFFKIVKSAFQQRRKILRNSLKSLNLTENLKANTIFDKRPEQLSVQSFINLVTLIENDLNKAGM
ncbi:MAG: 16S rRNA (adenine(1518)-N(6)/adenine(1519)-N(6))-dimethyltransferase [Flavobacteriaceae bacterium]|nr:16S rRNA (adenine(1518)-N(6)/adenine(1519)-N(6))-dimethyltransferase [Flavobacteriaceae bacterium]|tara:strand:- start:1148 stop:1936 length:789 start_codon:yes stop_codon:yes gene_type:complete